MNFLAHHIEKSLNYNHKSGSPNIGIENSFATSPFIKSPLSNRVFNNVMKNENMKMPTNMLFNKIKESATKGINKNLCS